MFPALLLSAGIYVFSNGSTRCFWYFYFLTNAICLLRRARLQSIVSASLVGFLCLSVYLWVCFIFTVFSNLFWTHLFEISALLRKLLGLRILGLIKSTDPKILKHVLLFAHFLLFFPNFLQTMIWVIPRDGESTVEAPLFLIAIWFPGTTRHLCSSFFSLDNYRNGCGFLLATSIWPHHCNLACRFNGLYLLECNPPNQQRRIAVLPLVFGQGDFHFARQSVPSSSDRDEAPRQTLAWFPSLLRPCQLVVQGAGQPVCLSRVLFPAVHHSKVHVQQINRGVGAKIRVHNTAFVWFSHWPFMIHEEILGMISSVTVSDLHQSSALNFS